MSTKVFSYTACVPGKVIAALGDAAHIRQARVLGAFKSRAAFVRALIAQGVENGSEGSVARFVSTYGGESGPREDVEPGVIYVESINRGGRGRVARRWDEAAARRPSVSGDADELTGTS
jgi:hypothetical protein